MTGCIVTDPNSKLGWGPNSVGWLPAPQQPRSAGHLGRRPGSEGHTEKNQLEALGLALLTRLQPFLSF